MIHVTQLVAGYGVTGLSLWLLCFVVACGWWLYDGRQRRLRVVADRLLPVAFFYGVYSWLASYAGSPAVVARSVANGERVVGFERFLHVGIEHWFYPLDVKGSAVFYDWAEIAVTVLVVSYLAVVAEGRSWRVARNSLALVVAGGLTIFYFVPVAPPRLLPASYGFPHFGLGALSSGADQIAAMPSMHTAFAGWVAAVLWYVLPARFRWLGPLYVGLTAVVVLSTGNHYVSDVVAGECLALLAVSVPLARVRCRVVEYGAHYHWRRAAAEACWWSWVGRGAPSGPEWVSASVRSDEVGSVRLLREMVPE